jgi:hypothetical protein
MTSTAKARPKMTTSGHIQEYISGDFHPALPAKAKSTIQGFLPGKDAYVGNRGASTI